ncbi:MAG: helical backbone metal receptor [Candidatus Auribacterota bacterium]
MIQKNSIAWVLLALCFMLIALGNIFIHDGIQSSLPPPPDFKIVSLSPALTEIAFLLGQGDKLAGVTRFCKYPAEAQSIPHVGGFYDVNLEMIAHINPQYVLITTSHHAHIPKLKELNIPYVQLDIDSPENIMNSILTLGSLFGVPEKAEEQVRLLREETERYTVPVTGLAAPKVLIIIGNDDKAGDYNKWYVVGGDSFYTPLLNRAGGINVVADSRAAYPILSPENIITLNPDIIIELIPGTRTAFNSLDTIVGRFPSFSMVAAVKNKRLYTLESDFLLIPGPRFNKILATFHDILHDANTGNTL